MRQLTSDKQKQVRLLSVVVLIGALGILASNIFGQYNRISAIIAVGAIIASFHRVMKRGIKLDSQDENNANKQWTFQTGTIQPIHNPAALALPGALMMLGFGGFMYGMVGGGGDILRNWVIAGGTSTLLGIIWLVRVGSQEIIKQRKEQKI